jgi:hypothetical protein
MRIHRFLAADYTVTYDPRTNAYLSTLFTSYFIYFTGIDDQVDTKRLTCTD